MRAASRAAEVPPGAAVTVGACRAVSARLGKCPGAAGGVPLHAKKYSCFAVRFIGHYHTAVTVGACRGAGFRVLLLVVSNSIKRAGFLLPRGALWRAGALPPAAPRVAAFPFSGRVGGRCRPDRCRQAPTPCGRLCRARGRGAGGSWRGGADAEVPGDAESRRPAARKATRAYRQRGGGSGAGGGGV